MFLFLAGGKSLFGTAVQSGKAKHKNLEYNTDTHTVRSFWGLTLSRNRITTPSLLRGPLLRLPLARIHVVEEHGLDQLAHGPVNDLSLLQSDQGRIKVALGISRHRV